MRSVLAGIVLVLMGGCSQDNYLTKAEFDAYARDNKKVLGAIVELHGVSTEVLLDHSERISTLERKHNARTY